MVFLLLINLFCLFQLQKTLHKVIFTIFNAVFAFLKNSWIGIRIEKSSWDPDPHCE